MGGGLKKFFWGVIWFSKQNTYPEVENGNVLLGCVKNVNKIINWSNKKVLLKLHG
jgi:hypothetical protein